MAFGMAAVAGIISGSVPKLLSIWENKQDNAQELAILAKTLEANKEIEHTRLDVSRLQGVEDSYQASLKHDTNSAKFKGFTWFGKFLMDMVNVWRASMRPWLVSTMMWLYVAFKAATIYTLCNGNMDATSLANALVGSWGAHDWALLEGGFFFYVTNRGVEKLSGKQ